jgi:hypothetical protein
VAYDAGIGIVVGEGLQQLVKGMLLGFSAGVFCNAIGIKTAFIDNTE